MHRVLEGLATPTRAKEGHFNFAISTTKTRKKSDYAADSYLACHRF